MKDEKFEESGGTIFRMTQIFMKVSQVCLIMLPIGTAYRVFQTTRIPAFFLPYF